MRHFFPFLSFLLVLATPGIAAEVSGLITTTDGIPLPFVNVYQANTTNGATSNVEGRYTINVPEGTTDLVFLFIGYKEVVKTVTVDKNGLVLNVQLEEESVTLSQIVVSADAEDPAYAVIRKAIKKRSFYLNAIDGLSCNAYIKGNQKLLAAPEKIMGQEIGDLDGMLDSNRQGIVYLSESISKLYFQKPDLYKEEMTSSKVSGDDRGFSFNQAQLMNFNLYNNKWDMLFGMGRPIISPIAKNALLTYNYKLIGTFYDKEGRLVNKIQVIPKRDFDPAYKGFIYIIEDLWNIHSTELFLTKEASKIEYADTLFFNQINVNVDKRAWVQLSLTVHIHTKVLGFHLKGYFAGIFSDYKINPDFPPNFFTNEIFSVAPESNERSEVFWDSIRPIPLTDEEGLDYVVKDSLQIIWRSKSYLDSTDRENNKFKPLKIITGYTLKRSYKKRSYSITSPVSTLQFNTVEGWNVDLKTKFRQAYDDYDSRWLSISPVIHYSFAEKKLRGSLHTRYNFNNINSLRLDVNGGWDVVQFNGSRPITPTVNTLYSLMGGKNYMKVYDKLYAKSQIRYEFINGFYLWTSLEFSKRRPLVNHTNYSFVKDGKNEYTSNDPLDAESFGVPSFAEHNAFLFDVSLRVRINQKYISYPYIKVVTASPVPNLNFRYRKAIGFNDNFADYDLLSFSIYDNLDLKLFGRTRFVVESSIFLNKKNLPFIDFRHFYGNQTILANYKKYLNTFQLMPYYSFSTDSPYLQAHLEHRFEGFIWNKLPLLKKLGFQTVVGAHYLYQKDEQGYLEVNFGLDNIGWKIARFLRVDYVMEVLSEKKIRSGFVIGFKINLDN